MVNALVDDRFGEALEEAKCIDDALVNREHVDARYTLLGVPFTGKESHSVEGLSWTSGIVTLKVMSTIPDVLLSLDVYSSSFIYSLYITGSESK